MKLNIINLVIRLIKVKGKVFLSKTLISLTFIVVSYIIDSKSYNYLSSTYYRIKNIFIVKVNREKVIRKD